MSPLLQIRGREVVVSTDPERVEAARVAFHDDWFIRLPALLDASTLEGVLDALDHGKVVPRVHPGIGVEACFERDVTLARLEFQLSDPRVLAFVGQIAGHASLGHFLGRVYRVSPGAGHHDDWHDDVKPSAPRLAALSLNLGRLPYQGGTLEIRRLDGGDAISVPNLVPGDAVLFRLDESLVHRITPIEGDTPKTAMAGWFCFGPDEAGALRAKR